MKSLALALALALALTFAAYVIYSQYIVVLSPIINTLKGL